MRKNHRDKTKERMRHRSRDRRVQGALQAARDHEAALDARIALEQAQSRVVDSRAALAAAQVADRLGEVGQAEHVLDVAQDDLRAEREAEARRQQWPLSDARDLIRQGYSLEHTIARTGWPERMLADVLVHEW